MSGKLKTKEVFTTIAMEGSEIDKQLKQMEYNGQIKRHNPYALDKWELEKIIKDAILFGVGIGGYLSSTEGLFFPSNAPKPQTFIDNLF